MVATILAGIFLFLHGFVHLLYYAQSAGRFQLKPGMTWPSASWLLARPLGEKATRTFASLMCVLVAAGLVIGAVGLISSQAWWRSLVVASAAVSALMFVLCWDGSRQNLDGQGGIGVLIDGVILVLALMS
jgi:hypothetical protein